MDQTFSPEKTNQLSSQEQKVLELLLKGFPNKRIALELQICEKTVEKHLTAISRKIEVTSRVEAILRIFNIVEIIFRTS
jgi:DNA-binding NarL/FixJ family response regulator